MVDKIFNVCNVEVWKYEDYFPKCLDGFRMIGTVGDLWLEVKGVIPEDKEIKYAKINERGMLRPFEKYDGQIRERNSHQFGRNRLAYALIEDNIEWIKDVINDTDTCRARTKGWGGRKKGRYEIYISFYNKKVWPEWGEILDDLGE